MRWLFLSVIAIGLLAGCGKKEEASPSQARPPAEVTVIKVTPRDTSVGFDYVAGAASAQLHDLFTDPAKTWNYAGSLTGPIFTAGAISAQVAQAEAAKRAALIAYQLAIQNAFADVESALSSREQLGEQLAAQQRLVNALQEYSKLARILFDGGYESYTTVLLAEQQLFPEELNLAATRAQLFGSLADIYMAMGGGWLNTADRMTTTGTTSPVR
jgi:outer membrane protein, multidrug efflux system